MTGAAAWSGVLPGADWKGVFQAPCRPPPWPHRSSAATSRHSGPGRTLSGAAKLNTHSVNRRGCAPTPPATFAMGFSVQGGGIAQLEEHLLCKQGVVGSSPITSTNSSSKAVRKIPAHERAPLRRMGMGKEEMTGLGFRTMARDEVLGFRPDLNEHQLAPRSEGSQRTRSCPTGGKQCGRGPAARTGSEPEQSHYARRRS